VKIASPFCSPHYARINKARLEHLESLKLPLEGKTVLELGAGIGDLTDFFVNQDCDVTCVDGRVPNVCAIQERHPWVKALLLDVEEDFGHLGQFDVVFAYGLLYHLERPFQALRRFACHTSGVFLLETKVLTDLEAPQNPLEDVKDRTQALHGVGSLLPRQAILATLSDLFQHVYIPTTQPEHEEFLVDWANAKPPCREIFVASRSQLSSPNLIETLR